jgi:AAA+ ATPase superfamily predicted ATPase
MENFYDRDEELALLEQAACKAEKTSSFTLLIGRRRIGKTALLMEYIRHIKQKKYLYLFVSNTSEAVLAAQFQQEAAEGLGIQIFGSVTRFRDFFEELLRFGTQHSFTLIIDEFQNFEKVNPAIFSDIQNLWDVYLSNTKINFIVCGSIYTLMIKLFENQKEPLFGRNTAKIVLKPFKVSVLKTILNDHNNSYTAEDLLCLYLISGGVPKYVALLMDSGAVTFRKMLNMVCRQDSPFLNEGKELLVSEFGRDYATYFAILQLVAGGMTTQSEIDSIIGKNSGAYLLNLERQYTLLSKNRPLFSKPESRNVRWKIHDHYLRFYFRFIYPRQGLVETGRLDLLREIIAKDYETYSGHVLEQYFRDKMAEEERVTSIGGYWDRKGDTEIDILALNDIDKRAVVAEVKRNAKKIDMKKLELKAERLSAALAPYKVELRGLSLDDM